jgi:hypothetical protein
MNPTGHWNRLDKRIREIWPRDILEQEKQKLEEARRLYRLKVNNHIASGGRINRDHDWVFEFIIRQSLTEMKEKIDVIDILEDVLSANSAEWTKASQEYQTESLPGPHTA